MTEMNEEEKATKGTKIAKGTLLLCFFCLFVAIPFFIF